MTNLIANSQFTLNDFNLETKLSYQIFNNSLSSGVMSGDVLKGNKKVKFDSLLVGNSIESVLRGNRVSDRPTQAKVQKLLTRQKTRNGFTPSLLDRLTVNDQEPDLFLNDGSKMAVGFFTKGSLSGLAVIAYQVKNAWKTAFASIKLKEADSGTYYTATFYFDQTTSIDEALSNSQMSMNLSPEAQYTKFLEWCAINQFDPTVIANMQLNNSIEPPAEEATADDLDLLLEEIETARNQAKQSANDDISEVEYTVSTTTEDKPKRTINDLADLVNEDIKIIQNELGSISAKASQDAELNGDTSLNVSFNAVIERFKNNQFDPVSFDHFVSEIYTQYDSMRKKNTFKELMTA